MTNSYLDSYIKSSNAGVESAIKKQSAHSSRLNANNIARQQDEIERKNALTEKRARLKKNKEETSLKEKNNIIEGFYNNKLSDKEINIAVAKGQLTKEQALDKMGIDTPFLSDRGEFKQLQAKNKLSNEKATEDILTSQDTRLKKQKDAEIIETFNKNFKENPIRAVIEADDTALYDVSDNQYSTAYQYAKSEGMEDKDIFSLSYGIENWHQKEKGRINTKNRQKKVIEIDNFSSGLYNLKFDEEKGESKDSKRMKLNMLIKDGLEKGIINDDSAQSIIKIGSSAIDDGRDVAEALSITSVKEGREGDLKSEVIMQGLNNNKLKRQDAIKAQNLEESKKVAVEKLHKKRTTYEGMSFYEADSSGMPTEKDYPIFDTKNNDEDKAVFDSYIEKKEELSKSRPKFVSANQRGLSLYNSLVGTSSGGVKLIDKKGNVNDELKKYGLVNMAEIFSNKWKLSKDSAVKSVKNSITQLTSIMNSDETLDVVSELSPVSDSDFNALMKKLNGGLGNLNYKDILDINSTLLKINASGLFLDELYSSGKSPAFIEDVKNYVSKEQNISYQNNKFFKEPNSQKRYNRYQLATNGSNYHMSVKEAMTFSLINMSGDERADYFMGTNEFLDSYEDIGVISQESMDDKWTASENNTIYSASDRLELYIQGEEVVDDNNVKTGERKGGLLSKLEPSRREDLENAFVEMGEKRVYAKNAIFQITNIEEKHKLIDEIINKYAREQ